MNMLMSQNNFKPSIKKLQGNKELILKMVKKYDMDGIGYVTKDKFEKVMKIFGGGLDYKGKLEKLNGD